MFIANQEAYFVLNKQQLFVTLSNTLLQHVGSECAAGKEWNYCTFGKSNFIIQDGH